MLVEVTNLNQAEAKPPSEPRPEPLPEPWYRHKLVWMLIAIPSSAVVFGIGMLTLAIQSDDGLVEDDYYKHGKEINRVLKRDQAAALYGLRADVTLEQTSLLIQLASQALPKPPATLQVKFLHATRAGNDALIQIEHAGDGSYRAELPELAAGRWHIQLEADNWRLTGEFMIPGDRRLKLDSRQGG